MAIANSHNIILIVLGFGKVFYTTYLQSTRIYNISCDI